MKRKNIVLVQPTVGYMDAMRSAPTLPLALLHACSHAAQDYEIRIMDIRKTPDFKPEMNRLVDGDTLMVGMTGFTGPMLRDLIKVAKHMRATQPEVPLVWGGIHASLLPEMTLQDDLVDIVVNGEGEYTLHELAQRLEKGESLEGLPGVLFKTEDGTMVKGPPRPLGKLGEMNEPAYDVVDINSYLPVYQGQKSLFMQASRGCPFPCTYCYNVVFNNQKWRFLPTEEVLRRVGRARRDFGVENIYFVDDNFFIHLKRGKDIMEGFKQWDDLTWQVQGVDISYLRRMDDDYVQLMIDSGCTRITMGVESGSQRMRDHMKKPGTVDEIIKTVERLAKHDIIIYCSFIVGVPNETLEELKETIKLIFRLHQINPNVRTSPLYNYTPYPGTQLYREAIEAGFKPPPTLEGWADMSFEECTKVWKKQWDEPFLQSLYLTSLMVDRKAEEYSESQLMRLAAKAYRPIARFRLKHLYFGAMAERHVAQKMLTPRLV